MDSASLRRRSARDLDAAAGTTDGAAIDSAATAARLRLSATRLARLLRRQADSGLTPTQLSALATIARHGPLSLGDLAEREGVAPPTVTRVVAYLETEDLLNREADPTDGRVALVRVTPAGRALIDSSRRRKTAWLAARVDRLPAEQLERLGAALDVLDALAIEDET